MKHPFILALVTILFSFSAFSQPSNNNCGTPPPTLTVGTECTTISGSLYLATANAVTWTGGGGLMRDVWYQLTVPANSTSVSIKITLPDTRQINTGTTYVELFNSTACPASSNSLGNYNISSIRTYGNLIGGQKYILRVATTHPNASTDGNTRYGFNICATSNDNCDRAAILTTGTTVDGSVLGASASSIMSPTVPVGCAVGDPNDDVWFKFTATLSYAAVSLTSIGTDLLMSGAQIQVYSGTCGTLTSIACGRDNVALTNLTPTATYYIRVYSAPTIQSAGAWDFRIIVTPAAPTQVTAGRFNEVYRQQNISPPQGLADPWEVIYGPDNKLWLTEAKGYRVYRVDPVNGARETILDVSQGSKFLPAGEQTFNCQFNNGNGAQGGFAGMALHPKFLDAVDPKNYVYVAYVHSQTSGTVFTNRVVRFEYNTTTGKLQSPISLCDTLPGSNDHNSQRMIIAPVGGVDYLFYASGDMGAGQFGNNNRPIRAQLPRSSEGKILRFNLEPDGDLGAYERWIPSTGTGNATNPYNASLAIQSATWAIGIRNNQGFAYDRVLDKLYGSSHGPFSDDEINVIQRGKNYGHPLVIGYAADGNVNNTTAGAAPGMNPNNGICPVITNEVTAAAAIPDYKDPLFSAYPRSKEYRSIKTLWDENPISNNGLWPSEGWSGLDLYTHTLIPGWSRSLIASSLKWGRLVRIRLDKTGDSAVHKSNADSTYVQDTVSYFGSQNRFRDIALAPNGKDLYVVMDRSTTTSGPSSAFPVVPACQGCLQKYSFLGYGDVLGQSSIDTSIDVTHAAVNACNTGTTITIDNSNNNLWVPITGPDGNIMAEIYPNGQNLGTVTSSFYKHSGAIRTKNGSSYADRNVTITPQNQPALGSPVKVRIYLSKKEFQDFDANALSGITSVSDLRIHKNSDPCQSALGAPTTVINPTFKLEHGDSAYVLQADISGFSTFYIGSTNVLLPLTSLNFNGKYKENVSYLNWETSDESNTDRFDVERHTGDGIYASIGSVQAKGNTNSKTRYSLNDNEASKLGTSRIYYRLKIIDRDGSYTYSNVVVVDIPGSFITRISIFPNPADKQTTVMISSPEEQKVTMQLVDVTGRSVINKTVVLKKGENRLSIDLNTLRTGVYFLQVKGQFVNAQEKIQKL